MEHDDNNNSSIHGHGGIHGGHGGLLAVGTAGMDDLRRESNATEREGSQEPHDHVGSTLVSNPMGSLYEVTKFRGLRTQRAGGERYRHLSEMSGDFISRGVITQQDGEELFEMYAPIVDHNGQLLLPPLPPPLLPHQGGSGGGGGGEGDDMTGPSTWMF